MLVAGGLTALCLFRAFCLSSSWVGFKYRKTDRTIGDALIGISAIVFVAANLTRRLKITVRNTRY